MYESLSIKINEILEEIPAIKRIYPYPLLQTQKIEQYPSAIFFPDVNDNRFETNADNFKEYRYKLYIIVGVNDSTIENVWLSVLPKVVDTVISEFDKNWSMGVTGSNRTWVLLENGSWTQNLTDKGIEAIAELNLRIRLLNPID